MCPLTDCESSHENTTGWKCTYTLALKLMDQPGGFVDTAIFLSQTATRPGITFVSNSALWYQLAVGPWWKWTWFIYPSPLLPPVQWSSWRRTEERKSIASFFTHPCRCAVEIFDIEELEPHKESGVLSVFCRTTLNRETPLQHWAASFWLQWFHQEL